MSACALKYARAIASPFSPEAIGACIPRNPARPSHKVTGRLRFTVTAGTSGYWFLAVTPSTANDRFTAWHSTATFAGTSTVGTTSATTGVTSVSMAGIPYSSAALTDVSTAGNPLVSSRIVSMGVAVQYTGTALNLGGTIRSYVDPNHNNLFGQDFSANSSTGVSISAVSRKRLVYELSAIDSGECEYPNGEYGSFTFSNVYPFSQGKSLNATDANHGGAPLLIDGNTVPGNTFMVDIVMHAEYIGMSASASLTVSHADAIGYETVAAASAMVTPLRAANPDASSEALMSAALRSVAESLRPVAIGALTNIGKSLISRLG